MLHEYSPICLCPVFQRYLLKLANSGLPRLVVWVFASRENSRFSWKMYVSGIIPEFSIITLINEQNKLKMQYRKSILLNRNTIIPFQFKFLSFKRSTALLTFRKTIHLNLTKTRCTTTTLVYLFTIPTIHQVWFGWNKPWIHKVRWENILSISCFSLWCWSPFSCSSPSFCISCFHLLCLCCHQRSCCGWYHLSFLLSNWPPSVLKALLV